LLEEATLGFSEDSASGVVTPIRAVKGNGSPVSDRRSDERRAHNQLGPRVGEAERRRGERRAESRRGFERLLIEIPVEQHVGTDVFYRVSSDLSVLGLSIRNATPHPPKTLVWLRFTLPDCEEGRPIGCYGLVTGPLEDGLGMRVKFIALDARHTRRIARFVTSMARRQSLA
jgi:hypothetical protein